MDHIEDFKRRGGAIIITGPSSCGKESVSQKILKNFSIPEKNHLAMGFILREAFRKGKTDQSYRDRLAKDFQIGTENIFSCLDTTPELTEKVLSYKDDLATYLKRNDVDKNITQLEWLEYCTVHGLLVPNRWTQAFITVEIDDVLKTEDRLFIIDGYPRTVKAAEHLLNTLEERNVSIVKVLHVFISKQEMVKRAKKRGRIDDDDQALHNRYNFYVESVQPSVDYMKNRLGTNYIALIDGHQPIYIDEKLDLEKSIDKVAVSCINSIVD